MTGGAYPMEEAMFQIAESVCTELLGLGVQPGSALPEAAPGLNTMDGCVHISGAWMGAVRMRCPVEFARVVAASMFGMPAEAAGPDDLQDALGEVVNQIGGNLKALLPDGCQVSLPAVTEGTDYAVHIPGAQVVNQIVVECGGHPIVVALLQGQGPAH